MPINIENSDYYKGSHFIYADKRNEYSYKAGMLTVNVFVFTVG